jgi:hypothetical protein
MRDENLLSAGHVVDNAAPGVRAIPTGYLFNKKHYKKRTKPKEM